MKIGIASDHRGVYLKSRLVEYLEHAGYKVVDYGTNSIESADFPKYAFKLGKGIKKKEVNYGIAICGTGIGMSIALNKMKGVYCAKISNISEAVLCRNHNDANVIAISADIVEDQAKSMVDKFITTPFLGEEKYSRRINMIKEQEEKMTRFLLYILAIPIVVFAMDSVNINGMFKKGQSNYYQARVMYMIIVASLSYLLVNFMNDFLGVFR